MCPSASAYQWKVLDGVTELSTLEAPFIEYFKENHAAAFSD
jgi:hypothetical protein